MICNLQHGCQLKKKKNILNAKICHSFWPFDLVIWSLSLKNFDLYQTTYVDQFWLQLVKSYDLYQAEHSI